jgi:hypothetical protein
MNSLKRSLVFSTVAVFVFSCVSVATAQVVTPRPSQKACVMQTIGVTDVTITYSRPGVKGRKIWGEPTPEQASTKGESTLDNQNVRPKDAVIVPYGHVWRTGANEATMFVVTDDVLINGQKLAAGTYAAHRTDEDRNGRSFSTAPNQWGSFNTIQRRYTPRQSKTAMG